MEGECGFAESIDHVCRFRVEVFLERVDERSMFRVLLGFLLGIFVLEIKGEDEGCNVNEWVPDESDRGYWVLCVESEERLNVYENIGKKPITIRNFENIRENLRRELNIQSTYTFSVISKHVNDKEMTFRKQPFAIYEVSSDTVRRLDPGKETLSQGKIYVLIEGGMWRWPPMRVGYKRELSPDFELETLAVRPALFRLEVSSRVRQHVSDVLQIVESRKMKRSQISGKGGRNKIDLRRRSSYTSFVSYEESPALMELLHMTARDVLHVDAGFEHDGTGGFESDIQTVQYKKKGHYDAHRDYFHPMEYPHEFSKSRFVSPNGYWKNRHATVLWYLQQPDSRGGETWFPRASPTTNWSPEDGDFESCDKNVGLLIPPHGVVLFYNLKADGTFDNHSWHAGCRVDTNATSPKLMANMWLWNSPPSYLYLESSTINNHEL